MSLHACLEIGSQLIARAAFPGYPRPAPNPGAVNPASFVKTADIVTLPTGNDNRPVTSVLNRRVGSAPPISLAREFIGPFDFISPGTSDVTRSRRPQLSERRSYQGANERLLLLLLLA